MVKKGDIVICVNPGPHPELDADREYEVIDVSEELDSVGMLHLRGVPGLRPYVHRFKLKEEPLTAGPKYGDPSILRMNPGIYVEGGAGVKYDQDKPDMSLLSSIAMVEVAKVMTFGKKKYAAHNWRGGFAWSRPLAAGLRHVFAFLGGQDNDPETGLSHLAHAICCFMFVLEFVFTKAGSDDRYKTEELKNASNQ